MKYEQTQLQIKKSMDLLKSLNCLSQLTENEKLQVVSMLRDIATTAIIDTQSSVDNLLQENFHSLKDTRPIFLLDDPLETKSKLD